MGKNIYHSRVVPATTNESCRYVHLIDIRQQCAFVSNHPRCIRIGSYIEYVPFFYCNFNGNDVSMVGGLIILILLLLVTFIILGLTADAFFCPALSTISTFFGLSETVAGVTVLAFGNGSPDIFTSMAAAPKGSVAMVLGELLGAGVFVTTVVAGAVVLFHPFKMHAASFLRDCIFYIFCVIWIYAIFYDNHLSYWETTSMIVIYVAYVMVVLIGSFIEGWKLKRDQQKKLKAINHLSRQGESAIQPVYFNDKETYLRSAANETTDQVRRRSTLTQSIRLSRLTRGSLAAGLVSGQPPANLGDGIILPPATIGRSHSVSRLTMLDLALRAERLSIISKLGIEEQLKLEKGGHTGHRGVSLYGNTDVAYERPTGLFKEFLYEMIPIDIVEWPVFPWYWKALAILKAPFVFFLKLVIPVVNGAALNNGWCKLLNVLHCIIVPVFIFFTLTDKHIVLIGAMPTSLIVLSLGLILAIIVFFTSVEHRPPKYHIIFAFMGFATSIIVIYTTATEAVNILHCIGVVFRINEAALGLSILAWGNSIGDLVSNTAVARAGYPKMGFAACFGGPLFNTLIGTGVSLSMAVAASGKDSLVVYYGALTPNCVIFLLYSLVSCVLAFPLMGFEARRSFGIYMMFLYGMFLVFCLLCEFRITHPFGTHQDVH